MEASLLMPFVLGIWMLLICLCLYLHDRTVLASCAAECAGKGAAEKYQTNQELEVWVRGQMQGLAQGRLLAVQELAVSVEVTQSKVKISYTGKVPLLDNLRIQGTEYARRVSPVERIRGGRRLGEFWNTAMEQGKGENHGDNL